MDTDEAVTNLLMRVHQFVANELMDDSAERIILENAERKRKEKAESSRRRGGRKKYIDRDREGGDAILFKQYFAEPCTYQPDQFRRRYRMSRELFLRIVEALSNHSEYFQMRVDATGRNGFSPFQKCTCALRMLAYANPADAVDEHIRLAESTAIECLTTFCRFVIEVFGTEYLRRPNHQDVQKLLEKHEQKHGFRGMLGSVDCMHWAWRNCPVAWKGQFTRGDKGMPTIMLEAVASHDLWIWHAYFGVPGSNNDINLINQSPLFNDVVQGFSPEIKFTVNGAEYTKGYYLGDGIYPEWATIVKSFSYPEDPKRKLFSKMQESARKDVERAFGVLQSRWGIIRGAARFWHTNTLSDIMYACIILHNMIVENEGASITNWSGDEPNRPIQISPGSTPEFQAYLRRNAELHDSEVHHKLRADLVEHIWQRFGDDNNEN